jgi:rod shape-determining protein MreD
VRAWLALTVFGGNIAQTTVAPILRVGGVTPDIPLIVVVLLALRRGPEFGCVAGFAAGLIQDAAGGGFIGVQALTKALAGFAMGMAASRLRPTQPLVQIPGLVLLSVAEGIVRYALLKFFHYPAPFGELMAYVVVPQALYNGIVGAALVAVMAWLEAHRAENA